MEECCTRKPSHKEWRRIAKRERRRDLRRKAAQERKDEEDRLRAALERNVEYLNWRAEQDRLEKEKETRELEEHVERERLWLEEEVKAQKEWQILQEQKTKAKQQYLEQQAKIREEFEAKQEEIRKQKEERRRKHEEQLQKQEQLQKEIDDYIDNGVKTPEILREVVDSQPTKDLCPFFTKTGACRFGGACSKNHRRVFLSKIILVPGFYSHFSLEKNSTEYDTDVSLEYENSEMRRHFYEFYKDVVSELKSFGRIKTLRCCCNTETHLRGNLYVEYRTEREAARAWRKLRGRWYAGKQLNCEFAGFKSWRSAVCGMTKCPKGRACNFLHTFRNPHDAYDIKSPPRWAKNTPQNSHNSRRSECRSKWEESVGDDNEEIRNWRWSESPEIELDHHSKITDKKRSYSTDRLQRSSSLKEHKQSGKSNVRNLRNSTSPEKYRQSSHKRNYENSVQNEIILSKRSSKKRRKESTKKNDNENGHKRVRKKHHHSHKKDKDKEGRRFEKDTVEKGVPKKDPKILNC